MKCARVQIWEKKFEFQIFLKEEVTWIVCYDFTFCEFRLAIRILTCQQVSRKPKSDSLWHISRICLAIFGNLYFLFFFPAEDSLKKKNIWNIVWFLISKKINDMSVTFPNFTSLLSFIHDLFYANFFFLNYCLR